MSRHSAVPDPEREMVGPLLTAAVRTDTIPILIQPDVEVWTAADGEHRLTTQSIPVLAGLKPTPVVKGPRHASSQSAKTQLVFARRAACPCGAKLAYRIGVDSQWVCAATLLRLADDSQEHCAPQPFRY